MIRKAYNLKNDKDNQCYKEMVNYIIGNRINSWSQFNGILEVMLSSEKQERELNSIYHKYDYYYENIDPIEHEERE